MNGEIALMFAVGAGPLSFAGWCWAGRSRAARWWVGNPFHEYVVRILIPAWGLIATPCVIMAMFEDTAYESAVDTLMIWILWMGIVMAFWGLGRLPLPRWWGPRWYRWLAEARRRPNVRDPHSALAVWFSEEPLVRSTHEAARVYSGSPYIGSWQGNYVYDADTNLRAHGLAPKGAVAGRLTVHEAGVVFAASKAEDTLRCWPTVLAIDAADITGVRVVPPRAGADGVKRRGVLYRSMFPRLVVDTSSGSHVFDLMRSGRVAEKIRPLMGQRR